MILCLQVYSLFIDIKRSTQFLIEYQNEFMFNGTLLPPHALPFS
jgi:hypothetical protein